MDRKGEMAVPWEMKILGRLWSFVEGVNWLFLFSFSLKDDSELAILEI